MKIDTRPGKYANGNRRLLAWLSEVDGEFRRLHGVGLFDKVPLCSYQPRDAFEAGVSATDYAADTAPHHTPITDTAEVSRRVARARLLKKTVDRVLESQSSRCMDDDEDREALAQSLVRRLT